MIQNTVMAKSRDQRWAEEAAFFDVAAENASRATLAIDPLSIARYARPIPRRRFNKEFRFRVMGPLVGKRILDVGCGNGLNAVQFATMGATVTGIDLSPKAIETARRRAEVNGVSDRVTFVCTPIEIADLADDSFDIVWANAILHHMLDEFQLTLCRLVAWTRPDGLLVCAEPMNLFEPIRWLRRMIPVRTEATPGERPLVKGEIEAVRRCLANPRMRSYMLFGFLDRFVLVNQNYERSPFLRRAISNAIAFADYALLSLPGLNRLAASCVIYGHPRKTTGGAMEAMS